MLHLSLCVYEIALMPSGEARPLMKQINNPMLIDKVELSEIKEPISPNELIAQYQESGDDLRFAYPVDDNNMDTKYTYQVITGVISRGLMPDPTQPIMVPADLTEEEHADYMRKMMTPVFSDVMAHIFVPCVPEYMFDIALSHSPETAVIKMRDEEPVSDMDQDEAVFSSDGLFHKTEADLKREHDAQMFAVVQNEFYKLGMMWRSNHPDEEFVPDYAVVAGRLGITEERLMELLRSQLSIPQYKDVVATEAEPVRDAAGDTIEVQM